MKQNRPRLSKLKNREIIESRKIFKIGKPNQEPKNLIQYR